MAADIRRWVKKKLDNGVDPDRLKAVLRNSDHDPSIVDSVLKDRKSSKDSPSSDKQQEKDLTESKGLETPKKDLDQKEVGKEESKTDEKTEDNEPRNSQEDAETDNLGAKENKSSESSEQFLGNVKRGKRKSEKFMEDDEDESVDLSGSNEQEDDRDDYSFKDPREEEDKGKIPSIDYSFTDLGLKRVSIGLFFILMVLAAPSAYDYVQNTNLDARMQVSMGEEKHTVNTDCTSLGVQIGSLSVGNGVTVVDGFTRGNPEIMLIARNNGKILDQETFQAGDTFSRTLRATKGEVKVYPVGCEEIFDMEVIG